MKVEINVDESMFKEVIDKELLALSQEELKGVVLDCIKNACTNIKNLDELLIKKKEYYNSQLYPTKLFEDIIHNIMTPEDFADVKSAVIDTIKNHMPEVVAIMIQNIFANAITDTSVIREMSDRFNSMVNAVVFSHISESNNK